MIHSSSSSHDEARRYRAADLVQYATDLFAAAGCDGDKPATIATGLVEADLLALIDEGKLSGATLDVFHDEPLPADHPFWGRAEIAITPHIAGTTLPQEAVKQIAAKIKRLERGLPVTGIVDRERGY